jgi:LmbE family N-acetylglucosaminyl deacetylase
MILPLVDEAEWLKSFRSLPSWNPPNKTVLVVAPHPDDETLGAGGLIAYQRSRNVEVVVAAVTDGEKAYGGMSGLARLRRIEQNKALGCLGINPQEIVRFGLPDGGVPSHEQELVDRLSPLISQDTHVVAPWDGDYHGDHKACGRAAQLLAQGIGATLSFYFFWTWHLGTPPDVEPLPLRRFPLTPELLALKSKALSCHQTQLVREGGDPVLPELLLGPARRPFEVFSTA